MNRFRKEFRLSGSGGQGLIVAGIILAKAASNEGYKVTQTQSFGPEARGGSSRTDVVISNNEIYFPEAQSFDYLIALTQEACDKYLFDLKEDGLLLIDSNYVKNLSMTVNNIVEVDFSDITIEKLGTALPMNIVTLSCIVKLSNLISEKALERAIKEIMKPSIHEINIKAMKLGFELSEQAKMMQ
ncbi:MAG: 2-oxoacid:acceptor oxidoreductase family protein [Candidatus Cloacimonetes bacterium]|nr:2-oxoacid:acceptor oxidoreductase family protein [Candidatus Cloacimonadota bacterium]